MTAIQRHAPTVEVKQSNSPVVSREVAYLLIVLCITFVTYLPSFSTWFTEHEFIHVGAAALTPTATFFARIWSLSDGGESLFHTNALYRPLFYSHVWLEHFLFGLNPFGYHVFSLGFHLLNVVLVWALARMLTKSGPIAAIAAGIFGIHPGPVDAVNWLSIINDLVMTTFAFLALVCFLLSWEAEGKRRAIPYALSLLFVVFALAEKEAAGALCVLLPSAYVLLLSPRIKTDRQQLLWLLPFLIIAFAYLGLRRAFAGNYFASEGVWLDWHTVHNFWWFQRQWGMPVVALHSENPEMAAALQILGAVALSILLYWGVTSKGAIGRFLVLWWLVGLLPFSLFPVGWAGDRYMYMPQFGLCILVAMALVSAFDKLVGVLDQHFPRGLLVAAGAVGVLAMSVFLSRQAISHMSYRTDSSHINRDFLMSLSDAIPVIEHGETLHIVGPPKDLSLFPDDGFYLGPAIHLWYGKRFDVRIGEPSSDDGQSQMAKVFRWDR